MRYLFFLLIGAIISGIASCSYHPLQISFENNSDKDLYVVVSSSINCHEGVQVGRRKVRSVFSDPFYESTVFQNVYIVCLDTFVKYNWEHIVDKNLILQQYVLYLTGENKFKGVLSYPPSENMKDIEMYPAYGENEQDRLTDK